MKVQIYQVLMNLRIGESSSFIDKDLNHMSLEAESARKPSGERKPLKFLRTSVDEDNKEQLRQNMILNPPACESKFDGLGDFLKYCNFCRKEIPQDKDVFMYRDYCAYCSEQCRDYQIELDEWVEKQLEASKAAVREQDAKMNGSH
ncbi:FCS-Like Zinc finger 17 isoform X2 [Daucus carota subsp. sativus]|uniref:FCS-Like Zinc finger 17 isoform X2 n=2 Tax=Daucus carota subsp. sativus TaxID=79200 RepID=UPI003083A2D6